MPGDLTQLLGAIDSGEPKSAEELLPLVYGDLLSLGTVALLDLVSRITD